MTSVSTRSRARRSPLVVTLSVAAVLALGALAASSPPASAQTASDGVRTLTASQSTGLDPNGQQVEVSGSGFEEHKGIYLAYCLEPLPGQLPTPCGGGVDLEGSTGSSAWISSNPPPYGEGLAIPYGPGGSFRYTINVSPMIGNIDCRRAQCVIVTRNDHTRTSDRSQDLFIPISFAEPQQPVDPDPDPGAGEPTTSVPVETTTTTPQPRPDEEHPAPEGTVEEDGRAVTSGEMRLASSKVADLDPAGETLIVTGSGFDDTRGLGVSFCAVPEGQAPGPCISDEKAAEVADGAVGTLWVSSNPSPERAEQSTGYGPLGAFGTTIGVVAEIDDETDCREVACAVVTLAHPDRPSDAGQNLVLPVTFQAEEEPDTTTTAAPTTAPTTAPAAEADDGGDGGGAGPLIAVIVALLAAAAVGGALWVRSRRSGSTPTDGGSSPDPAATGDAT